MKRLMMIAVVLFSFTANSFGQAEKEMAIKEIKEESLKGSHQLVLVLGHSHLFTGIKDNGKRGWLTVPSTGLDYNYWISDKWAIGLQNEIIIENFEVENHEEEVIKRTTPFSSIVTGMFKPGKRFNYLAGVGGEFAPEHNFVVTRIGVEPGWEMKNNWEFSISLMYDIKWNGYDSWSFGFGVSKLFKKKKHSHITD